MVMMMMAVRGVVAACRCSSRGAGFKRGQIATACGLIELRGNRLQKLRLIRVCSLGGGSLKLAGRVLQDLLKLAGIGALELLQIFEQLPDLGKVDLVRLRRTGRAGAAGRSGGTVLIRTDLAQERAVYGIDRAAGRTQFSPLPVVSTAALQRIDGLFRVGARMAIRASIPLMPLELRGDKLAESYGCGNSDRQADRNQQ